MVRLVGSLALVGVLVSICVGRMKLVNYCLELVRRGTRYCRMERSRIKDKPLRHSVDQFPNQRLSRLLLSRAFFYSSTLHFRPSD